MNDAVLLAAGFLLTWPATAWVRATALRRELLDHPNERSSHSVPTPRGGGLAFVVVFLALVAMVAAQEPGGARLAMALALAGVPVAAVGMADDLRNLPARVRAAVHAAAAAAAVALIGVPYPSTGAVVLGGAFLVVGLVWLVNLYNFMDGIDGLAAGQAVVAAAGIGVLAAGTTVATAAWILVGSVLGFLVLNAPPAKIFMGDVGSGFLGIALGVLGLAAWAEADVPLVVLALLAGPFIVDATATLLARVVRGERWYEPHRDHVYQRLVRSGRTHRQVTVLYVALAAALSVEAVLLEGRRWATAAGLLTLSALLGAWLLMRARTAGASSFDG